MLNLLCLFSCLILTTSAIGEYRDAIPNGHHPELAKLGPLDVFGEKKKNSIAVSDIYHFQVQCGKPMDRLGIKPSALVIQMAMDNLMDWKWVIRVASGQTIVDKSNALI